MVARCKQEASRSVRPVIGTSGTPFLLPFKHIISICSHFSQEERKSSFAKTCKGRCESFLFKHFKDLRSCAYLSREEVLFLTQISQKRQNNFNIQPQACKSKGIILNVHPILQYQSSLFSIYTDVSYVFLMFFKST